MYPTDTIAERLVSAWHWDRTNYDDFAIAFIVARDCALNPNGVDLWVRILDQIDEARASAFGG